MVNEIPNSKAQILNEIKIRNSNIRNVCNVGLVTGICLSFGV